MLRKNIEELPKSGKVEILAKKCASGIATFSACAAHFFGNARNSSEFALILLQIRRHHIPCVPVVSHLRPRFARGEHNHRCPVRHLHQHARGLKDLIADAETGEDLDEIDLQDGWPA